jgi:ubiquinone/menaquinone biosynthesis C-methylase UbiE
MSKVSKSPVARLFDAASRLYDAEVLQRLIYRPNQDLVLAELKANGAQRILDVGCGTGIFATRVTDELETTRVIGCDLSEGMLAQAAARSSKITWVQGDATRLPIAASMVDAVTCTEAFHFFDQPAALREFHRVLRPGGRLLVAFVNPRTKLGSRAVSAQASRALGGAGTWPTQGEMKQLVVDAGFDVRSQRRVSRIFGWTIPTILTSAIRPQD